jgi:hypothetical protein
VVVGGAFMFGSSLVLRLARRGEERGAA